MANANVQADKFESGEEEYIFEHLKFARGPHFPGNA